MTLVMSFLFHPASPWDVCCRHVAVKSLFCPYSYGSSVNRDDIYPLVPQIVASLQSSGILNVLLPPWGYLIALQQHTQHRFKLIATGCDIQWVNCSFSALTFSFLGCNQWLFFFIVYSSVACFLNLLAVWCMKCQEMVQSVLFSLIGKKIKNLLEPI